jgi:hypothetical protein
VKVSIFWYYPTIPTTSFTCINPNPHTFKYSHIYFLTELENFIQNETTHPYIKTLFIINYSNSMKGVRISSLCHLTVQPTTFQRNTVLVKVPCLAKHYLQSPFHDSLHLQSTSSTWSNFHWPDSILTVFQLKAPSFLHVGTLKTSIKICYMSSTCYIHAYIWVYTLSTYLKYNNI